MVFRGATDPGEPVYGEDCGTARGVYLHRREETAKCQRCRDFTAAERRRLNISNYVNGPRKIPSLGTQRRLRALARVGWRQSDVADRLGVTHRRISNIFGQGEVYGETADKISGLYRQLAWQRGPSAVTAERARRRGWPGPLDWDDPDDPNEVPACEIERAHAEALALERNLRRQRHRKIRQDRAGAGAQ